MHSPSASSSTAPCAVQQPTVWGLDPLQLHDRFWAARGVQVVRPSQDAQIDPHAEMFLLSPDDAFANFRFGRLIDTLNWVKPQLMWIRLHHNHDEGYRETVVTDDDQQFVKFERRYRADSAKQARFALTADRRVAELWHDAAESRAGWRKLREAVPQRHRFVISVNGSFYDRNNDHQVMQFIHELMCMWKRPDATISHVRQLDTDVWVHTDADVDPATHFVGAAWVGAGRSLMDERSVLGPAVLWDDPDARPAASNIKWSEIAPTDTFGPPQTLRSKLSSFHRAAKRTFDILFSLVVLLFTLPLYPLIMLAIWLEDGRPFFFVHWRETTGEREFPCLKFRSMRKDAEQIKDHLACSNQADGPQFFIKEDPRLTRVGSVLRRLQLDEFPQFINVLLGHMSVVGPRPSPYKENQYCPEWREARLSVRPGVTGLWQVRRTRQQGLDFQEWIRYDIEYVENASWRLDLAILWDTFRIVLGGSSDRS